VESGIGLEWSRLGRAGQFERRRWLRQLEGLHVSMGDTVDGYALSRLCFRHMSRRVGGSPLTSSPVLYGRSVGLRSSRGPPVIGIARHEDLVEDRYRGVEMSIGRIGHE
jgi:hypothetical protein